MATTILPTPVDEVKTVSLDQLAAEGRLRAVVAEVAAGGGDVLLEADGVPAAVVVSVTAYQALQAERQRDRERREAAWRQALAARERVRARNQDLTEEQAEELADRFIHEIVDEMAAEGKLRFARDEQP